jgi:hypothetical protein
MFLLQLWRLLGKGGMDRTGNIIVFRKSVLASFIEKGKTEIGTFS